MSVLSTKKEPSQNTVLRVSSTVYRYRDFSSYAADFVPQPSMYFGTYKQLFPSAAPLQQSTLILSPALSAN